MALVEGGDDAQQQRWLPRLADGSAVGAALCEEGSRWERAPAAAPMASPGSKLFVPHADRADLIVVGVEGGELVLVEREASGVKIESIDGVDRTRPVFRMELDGAPCQRLAPGSALAGACATWGWWCSPPTRSARRPG